MTPEEALAVAMAEKEKQDQAPSTLGDVAKGTGSGFLEGITNFMSGMGGANDMMPGEMTQPGASDPGSAIAAHGRKLESFMANPAGQVAESIAPGSTSYKPQTQLGKFGQTIGGAASGIVMGPGGVGRKALMSLGAGTVSEAGGQLAHEYAPAWEPLARVGGMVLGGVAGAGTPTPSVIMSAAKKAARGAPSEATLKTVKDQMYALLDKAGVKYDQYTYEGLGQRIFQDLMKNQHRPVSAAQAFQYADQLTQDALRGVSPNFMDMERLSQKIGQLARDAAKAGKLTEADGLNIVRDNIDDFAVNSPMSSPFPDGTELIKNHRGTVRSIALRTIKSHRIEEMMQNARDNMNGFVTGLNSEISSLLKRKADRQLFNENDRTLLREVRDGNRSVAALSKFGIDLSHSRIPVTSQMGIAAAPGIVALQMGSPAALPMLAIGAAGAVGSAAKSLRPGLAVRRMGNAAAALRSPEFDSVLVSRQLEANRRRMRQLMTGVPAANEARQQMGKDTNK